MKRKDGLSRSDKGKKRKEYCMKSRLFTKSIRDLLRTLERAERFEKALRRHEKRTTKAQRMEAWREARIPKNRTCPVCGDIKLNSRQWVISKHDHILPVCKGCAMRAK